ncbi:MAG: acetyl-CoA carboxylase biotin carboxyl carrier protein [Candidatus Marinimicrobia bacterium]|nr:acetyl-CoA carboxylase biotin carboxyl carrier protein [Candidatus Neomarinimicrobiota bacterium]
MWQDKLKEIIKILEESNVNEIEVNFWGRKFRVSKNPGIVGNPTHVDSSIPVEVKSPVPGQGVEVVSATTPEDGMIEVTAPMVGTFYSASSPETSPFVKVGDQVTVGQPLCIIEAMKIMNEIEAEVAGEIMKILTEDSQPVEYGQPLFLVKPV